MKRLIVIIALLAFSNIGYSQKNDGIRWMTLKEALNKNESSPKKIYIDVYTGWCGWCKRMDATTFEDKQVIKYMNEKFYCVKLDAETRDTIFYKNRSFTFKPEYKSNEIAAYMLNGKMGYPTSVYLDEKSDLIGPVQGYLTSDQLLPVLKYFGENIYKTTKWEDYLKEVMH